LQKVTAERKRLWDALNEYTRQEGAFIVSPPYGTPVRLEIIDKDSTLPALLARNGYDPHHAGNITRVMSSGIVAADIILFDLPVTAP
jgi:hypothetical protein